MHIQKEVGITNGTNANKIGIISISLVDKKVAAKVDKIP